MQSDNELSKSEKIALALTQAILTGIYSQPGADEKSQEEAADGAFKLLKEMHYRVSRELPENSGLLTFEEMVKLKKLTGGA